LLSPLRCAPDDGLALVVAEGNYKDEAALLAAGAVATAFADELEPPFLAEADLPPALRRAVLGAHDRVLALSKAPVAPGRFATAFGPRASLRGIGASVAAALMLPTRAWLTTVGECPIWLLREGTARQLSLPQTLAHDPGYRSAIAREPDRAIDFADSIVLQVLGVSDEVPRFDLTRLELRSRDRIALGNEWLSPHVEAAADRAAHVGAAALCQALAAAVEAEPGPIPISVAVGAVR
jgi:hypothetical protein